MKQEYWVETHIGGLYVSSQGSIKNDTGIKLVKQEMWPDLYVGLQITKTKRVMFKLANLVYTFHINRGKPVDKDMTVRFRDGDHHNCAVDNLYIDYRHVNRPVVYDHRTVNTPYYQTTRRLQ